MKHCNQRLRILFFGILCLPVLANAHDFEVGGIYYEIESDTTVRVTYGGNSYDSYYNEYTGKVVIPESVTYNSTTYSVTSIGKDAFRGRRYLTSVVIPNSVTAIGSYAFYGCSCLTSVVIPNSVITIGSSAFYDCGSLIKSAYPSNINNPFSNGTSIAYPANNVLFENGIIYNADKTKLYFVPINYAGSFEIPNSVTSIGNYAFSYCSQFNSVIFGSGLLSIGYDAFIFCSIIKAFWLGNTPPTGNENVKATLNYVSNYQYSFSNQLVYPFLSSRFEVDGNIFIPVSPSERTCDVVDCNYSDENQNVVIGEKVTNRGIEFSVVNVNTYAFYNNLHIKIASVSNAGRIGGSSFAGCSNISSLSLGDKVTAIDAEAFSNCSSVPNVVIPNSVESLGEAAFSMCRSLESVVLGTGAPTLPGAIFSNCSSLKSIEIPDNIRSVSYDAFAECESMTSLTINDSNFLLTLGSNGSSPLFADCPLDEVYIGRKLSYNTGSSYGYSPFYRNTSLRSVEISDAETQIYENEFYGCTNLQTLKIGDGVTTIGDYAFSGCSSLNYFSAGYHVETIGREAFSDCTGLTKFYSSSIVPPSCGSQALDDINKWNCQLYVPAESSDEYAAADQWKEFFFVNEMGTVPVVEIKLSANEAALLPSESLQLTAQIFPGNATYQALTWTSSDETVATVSANGLITAIAPGTATITVTNGEVNAKCEILVNSTCVESISISATANTLKQGKTLQLTAEVHPHTAIIQTVEWSSSNTDIANVSTDGVVSALSPGEVVITATSTDGTDISSSITLTVTPILKGDSNDNDELTITDAVNTANYAIGNAVETFNFDAADVDNDGLITLTDASATITEILNLPVAVASRKNLIAEHTGDADALKIRTANDGRIGVCLDNTRNYVALQADIVAEGNLTIHAIEIGDRAAANHYMMYRRIDDYTVRLALFNLDNSPFADSDEALFHISVIAENAAEVSISISNIIAADASAREYRLASKGSEDTDLSELAALNVKSVKVEETSKAVKIYNAAGHKVEIFTVDGKNIARFIADSNSVIRSLLPGIYIVKLENIVEKVVVK